MTFHSVEQFLVKAACFILILVDLCKIILAKLRS